MGIKRYKSLGELMFAREKEKIKKAKKKSQAMYKHLKTHEKSEIRIKKQDYLPHNKKEYEEYFGPYKGSFIAQRDSSAVKDHYTKIEVKKSKDLVSATKKMQDTKEKLATERKLLDKHKGDLKKYEKTKSDLIPFNTAKPEDIKYKKTLIKEYEDKISTLKTDSTNYQIKIDKLKGKKKIPY